MNRCRHPRTPEQGFSLIELLVAVLIIALLSGLLTLSMDLGGGKEKDLQRSVDRIYDSLQLARQEAILANEFLGLRLAQDVSRGWTLEWLRFRDGIWQTAAALPVLTNAGQEIQLTLRVEGETVQAQETDATTLPHLLMEPDGMISPFTLTLNMQGLAQPLSLGVDELGQVQGWRSER